MRPFQHKGNGRVQSLPFWFFDAPGEKRRLDGARQSDFAFASALGTAFAFPGLQFTTPIGENFTCFSELPAPGNDPSRPGPVLVMPSAKRPNRMNLWVQRMWLVVFVLFCLMIGFCLTWLPWTRLWTDNSLLIGFPAVKEFLSQNFVRGLVTGIGLVDMWVGVSEAVTYRERP